MSTALEETAIKRLAGLANVISALLGAIPILAPETRADALKTCASMAADVATNSTACWSVRRRHQQPTDRG